MSTTFRNVRPNSDGGTSSSRVISPRHTRRPQLLRLWVVGLMVLGLLVQSFGFASLTPAAVALAVAPEQAAATALTPQTATKQSGTQVGDGTATSCTYAALKNAISSFNIVTFSCGASPVTISGPTLTILGSPLTIDGGTLGQIVLSGGGNNSIFQVIDSSLTLKNMAVTNGINSGIRVRAGTLNLDHSAVYSNTSSVGGGIFNEDEHYVTSSGTDGYRCGSISLSHTDIYSNTAHFDGSDYAGLGGGIADTTHCTLTVDNASHIYGNTAAQHGGGIFSNIRLSFINGAGALTVQGGSQIYNNTSGDVGGGIYANLSRQLTLDNASFSGNYGTQGGGLWVVSNLISINNTVFNHNTGGNGLGGGAWIGNAFGPQSGQNQLNITNSTFSNNSGDGASLDAYGSVAITGNIFANNTNNGLNASGGDNQFLIDSTASFGNTFKGINFGSGNFESVATMTNSTIYSNSEGIFSNFKNVVIANSSIFNNTLINNNTGYASGYGILNIYGNLQLINSTVYNNGNNGTSSSTQQGQGNIENDGSGLTTLTNSILANTNDSLNCTIGASATGSFADGGNNLDYPGNSTTNSCGFSTAKSDTFGDPVLQPQDYLYLHGLVLVPQTGSFAIDAGNDTVCAATPINNIDQRGTPRPIGPHCDIGAIEAPLTGGTPSSTTTTLTSSPNPVVAGQPVNFVATVGTTSGTPTGSVNFYDGATLLGAATLNASKQATFATSSLAVGSHNITATYAGDTNFATSTSSVLTQNITATATVPGAPTDPAATAGDTQVALSWTVYNYNGGSPITGFNVYRLNGTTPVKLNSTPLAVTPTSYTDTGLTNGTPYTYQVTAINSVGEGGPSTQVSATPHATANPTTTTLTSSPNPLLVAQFVVFTATVATTSGTPTGSVNFYDGATLLGAATLSGGTASYSISSLAVGSHQIVATYVGNTSYTTSSSTGLNQIVGQNAPAGSTGSTSQSGLITNPTGIQFKVTVKDSNGTPVAYVFVTYAVQPGSNGAGGSFSPPQANVTQKAKISPKDATQVTVLTDNNGVATAPAFTGNGIVGSYSVVANIAGISTPVTFNLTNAANGYTYNLPLLANRATTALGNTTTFITFQNLNGSASANVSVKYFGITNGNDLSLSDTMIIAPKGQKAILPAIGVGSSAGGVVSSDQPLNVVVSEALNAGGSAYNVAGSTASTLYSPLALNGQYGFTTSIVVFNADSVSNATGNVLFFDEQGHQIAGATKPFSLAPHSSTTLNQAAAGSGLAANHAYWAKIVADNSSAALSAQVTEFGPNNFVATFNAIVPAQVQKTLYAPATFNGQFNFVTGIAIANPNPTAANLTIKYYDVGGSLLLAQPQTIAANGVTGVFQPNVSGLSNQVSSATVSSDQPLIMTVNEHGPGTISGTYIGLASGSTALALPVVANGFAGFVTGATVLNTSSTNSATLSMTYLDGNGHPIGNVQTKTLAPNASFQVFQGGSDQALPTGFFGTALITSDQPLLVTTNALQTGTGLFYTYTEPSN